MNLCEVCLKKDCKRRNSGNRGNCKPLLPDNLMISGEGGVDPMIEVYQNLVKELNNSRLGEYFKLISWEPLPKKDDNLRVVITFEVLR